jgi:hypothetical protein
MDSTPAAGFLRGDAPPAAPFPDCELLDAIEGELGCETPHNCQ